MDYTDKDILDLLTCQVCWATLTRPIFRCKFEHLLCQQCFKGVTKCPSCREPLKDNLRSLAMEQVADHLRVSCEYSEVGCPEVLPLKAKKQHEETCSFRPDATWTHCPQVYTCPWVGSRATVEEHVRLDHADELVVVPDGAFVVEASATLLLEFDSALFVVRSESVPQEDFTSHYVHVGHVAQGLRAAKSRYRFKVRSDPDGACYKGLVTDYRHSLQELAVAGDCLFFVSQSEQIGEVTFSGGLKKLPDLVPIK